MRSATPNGRDWCQLRELSEAYHERVVVLDRLAEAERKVTHGLRAALDANLLVVRERVHLAGDTRVVDHGARVGGQARHGAANVPVDLHNLLDGRALQQGGLHALLNTEHRAVRRSDADRRGAELASATMEREAHLDGLHGVLDWRSATLVRSAHPGRDGPGCQLTRDNASLPLERRCSRRGHILSWRLGVCDNAELTE